jgi:hypothetical protein
VLTRRAFALGLGAGLLARARPAAAGDPAAAPIPTLQLAFAVASDGGAPVRDDAWIDAQVAEAERLFGGLGVHLRKTAQRPLAERFAHLETRRDRDALAAETSRGVINVMLVGSLRDVDDPSRHRMGVHWRPAATPAKHYVIVSASAMPSVLAHELGHYFGNPHSAVPDNLMSYNRSGDQVFLDDAQARTIRSFARLYVRIGELAPAPAP